MNINNNKIYLTGIVLEEPVFSHEICAEKFYIAKIDVKRMSNKSDIIPVIIPYKFLQYFIIGNNISIEGQFRSYNKKEFLKSRLVLAVFVKKILPYKESNIINEVEIEGFICKKPIYRTTPMNREICDLLIAVNRSYNKSDYIPCVIWSKNARIVSEYSIGTSLKLVGRVQSRIYNKTLNNGNVEERIAYEISVNKVEKFKGSNI